MSPNLPLPALKALLDRLDDNRGDLLQYDAGKQQLVPYPWPLDEGMEPIHVDGFLMHHVVYKFPYPACFCPVLLGSAQNIQAQIRFSPHKSIEQRLVAVCEKDLCGYFANLFFQPGGLVQYYPLRVATTLILPHVIDITADVPASLPLAESAYFPFKPLDVAMGYPAELHFIPVFYPPAVVDGPSIPTLLYRLNSAHRPGLEEKFFRQLFKRCDCGIVSTTRTFEGHRCRTNMGTAIAGMDTEELDDGEVVRLLLRLDVGIPSLGVELMTCMGFIITRPFNAVKENHLCSGEWVLRRWKVHGNEKPDRRVGFPKAFVFRMGSNHNWHWQAVGVIRHRRRSSSSEPS